jgi:type IV pilus assembly protein PilB
MSTATETDRYAPPATMVAEVIAATALITEDHLTEAIAIAGAGLLSEAIAETVGGPEEVAKARAKHYGVPFVDLAEVGVKADAVEAVSIAVLKRVDAIPYDQRDGHLFVAVADPSDVQALDELRLASRYTVRLAVAIRDDIETELRRIERASEATERSSLMDVEFRAEDVDEDEDPDDLEGAESSAISKLLISILQQAANDGASDVHLDPTDRGLVVRFRIDGVLQEVQVVPRRFISSLTTLVKVMAKLDIAERRKPQDGRISMTEKRVGRALDVRVAILPTVEGECTVMRLLDTSTKAPTLSDLGFSDEMERRFQGIITRPTGALLVTGPTGSGKSTTLYATLTEIHRPEINVITVEDPVEYRLSGVQQVQINQKAGLSFATALRSMLRADPDVIMVGEIRDLETAKISIEAALTGHLVLSTLHTNDAPSALTRLNEMGVEPFLVSAAVSGVVAQRLARLLCTACKVEYAPTEEELVAARIPTEDWNLFQSVYRAEGCARCGKTGYRGRVGVYQLMTMSDDLTRLAAQGATRDELDEIARSEGMKSLWGAGLDVVADGKTSFEELRRVLV